jgi:acyl-CoA-binding protein
MAAAPKAAAAGDEPQSFSFVARVGEAKLGCWGAIKGTSQSINHYIVDSRGYRRVLNKPGEIPGRYDITDKSGKKTWVGFRPLGESPYLVGYFPDECFV